MRRPEFLTPVAEAQRRGVTVYWLGEEFPVGPLLFHINGSVELIDRLGGDPGLEFGYSAPVGEGSVPLDLESYLAQSPEAEAVRRRALAVPGSRTEPVRVGPSGGELFFLPAGDRPVNALWVFLDLDDVLVVAQAGAGSSGIAGTDVNPLIEADLLISVLAQHLRPYPE